jgi:hypothetical protein
MGTVRSASFNGSSKGIKDSCGAAPQLRDKHPDPVHDPVLLSPSCRPPPPAAASERTLRRQRCAPGKQGCLLTLGQVAMGAHLDLICE